MELPPALLQFIGSLIGIFLLAGLAYWLRLGPQPKLPSEDAARVAADQAVSGFDPVAIGLDREGHGAILRDAEGRLLVLRPHGSKFAGRVLTLEATVSAQGDRLVVDSGERSYGVVTLALDNVAAWVSAFEAIKGNSDA